jgi:peptidoglycan hydrolase CwlO-like protein
MTAEIALSLISKVIDIQKKYPEAAKAVDELQARLHETMKEIRKQLEGFSEREREVFTVSIINFIHEKADEVLLD